MWFSAAGSSRRFITGSDETDSDSPELFDGSCGFDVEEGLLLEDDDSFGTTSGT